MRFAGAESTLLQSWRKWEEKIVKLGLVEALSRPAVHQITQELGCIDVNTVNCVG